jgi:glycosyltransferase involved in cell wall biosynthesis
VTRRALFVTSSFPRWTGDSTTPFILHLAQDLRALGWDIDVLAPHAPGAARDEVLDGVSVHRFRYAVPERAQTLCYGGGALINLRADRTAALKVPMLAAAEYVAMRHIRKRYDLLHSHWVLPQGFLTALAAGSVPHLLTVHGSDVFALRARPFLAAKRYAFRRADAITANSSATEAVVRQLAPTARVERVPMGTDVDAVPDPATVADIRARHRRTRGPLLVQVGRVVREKGVEESVRALALLRDRLPDTTLALVGAGQDEQHVRDLAAELGCADRVVMPGWVDAADLPSWYAAADIVLAPSWIEAQGLSVIEALALARPVIASNVGGLPDVVDHERTGLLVPPRDPVALADSVVRLNGDEQLQRTLGAAGSSLVRGSFSRSASARRFDELYRALGG